MYVVSILQEGGPTPVLPTPPVIRVVLLHKQGDRVILYFLKMYIRPKMSEDSNRAFFL